MKVSSNVNNLAGRNMRSQFLQIQQAQRSNGLEANAAMSLETYSFDDFESATHAMQSSYGVFKMLDRKVRPKVIHARSVVEGINENAITCKPYEAFNLLKEYVTVISEGLGIVTCDITDSTKDIASEVVRIGIKKFNKQLTPTHKIELIADLLQSSVDNVRYEGVESLFQYPNWRDDLPTVFSHVIWSHWRGKYEHNRGSLEEFIPLIIHDEKSDSVRKRLLAAVSTYRPELLYEKDLLNIALKDEGCAWNMMWGAGRAVAASHKQGKYYEEFGDIPVISDEQKSKVFEVAEKLITRRVGKDLNENDLGVLQNCTYSMNHILQSSKTADVKSGASLIGQKFQSLSKKNLTALVKTCARNTSNGGTIWNNFGLTFSILLEHRAQSKGKQAARHLHELKKEVKELKGSPGVIDSYIENAMLRIDNQLTRSLTDSEWTHKAEFNAALTSAIVAYPGLYPEAKDALINFTNDVNEKGISIGGERLNFNAIVSDTNQEAIKAILQSEIHGQSTSPQFSRVSNDRQGHSLTAYRSLARSFDDYHGGSLIKEKVLYTTQQVLDGKDTKGMLLSGPRRTGKTFFGEVLAGETAMRHVLLKPENFDTNTLEIVNPISEGRKTIKDYFADLCSNGPTVFVLEEVNALLPKTPTPLSEQLISEITNLKEGKAPVVVIATTNYPGHEEGIRTPIATDGSSSQMDEMLESLLDERVFDLFGTTYYYHLPIVGSDFATSRLEEMQNTGKLPEGFPAELAEKCCMHIPPGVLEQESIFSNEKIYSLDEITAGLKDIQSRSIYIKELASLIETQVELEARKAKEQLGDLDYKEIAIEVAGIAIPGIDSKLEGLANFSHEGIVAALGKQK